MKVNNITDYEIIGWKAWYENDQFFESKTTDWKKLPDDGVLAVIIYSKFIQPNKENMRKVWDGYDYYFTTPESGLEVFCSDEEPSKRYPGACIKRGKWVPILEMQKINAITRKATNF